MRSAAVYGSNAAGKTNLLRAIQFMQEMVVTSAARPSGARATPYSPYKFSPKTRNSPSDFQITFPENNVRYEYGFSLSAERVGREWLIEYVTSKGRTLFQRDYDNLAKKYKWSFSSFFKGQRLLWSESTRPDSLFLSTVIQLNNTQLLPVFLWFQKRLTVIVGPATLNASLTYKLLEEPEGKQRVLPFLQEADFGIVDVRIKREPILVGSKVLGGPNVLLEHVPGQPMPNLVRVTMAHR